MVLRKIMICLMAGLFVFSSGCKKDAGSYDQNAVVLSDDGSIDEKCVLELGEYGDTEKVYAFIAESLKEINAGITEEKDLPVTAEKAERTENTVSVVLKYKAPEYYERLNNITFKVLEFSGDALTEAAGDLELKTRDGRTFGISEIESPEDCRIVVFAPESEYILKTPGDIAAYSGNAVLLEDDEALINGYSVIIYEN
ncbi:MAG: hypothetical protein IJM62_00620 [Lachnospiraceae bacterium]|nr:hypothetical protein [Lachnospiraceae bacterium]